MSDLKKAMDKKEFKNCKFCGGKLLYLYSGIYQCETCGTHDMDDFGKIKSFIDKNGPSPAFIISTATGVSMETIDDYLKTGRVEIPDNSPFFIKCARCGTDIKYGRYCPDCVRTLAGDIKRAFAADDMDMGERPNLSNHGKMHFINQRKKK